MPLLVAGVSALDWACLGVGSCAMCLSSSSLDRRDSQLAVGWGVGSGRGNADDPLKKSGSEDTESVNHSHCDHSRLPKG